MGAGPCGRLVSSFIARHCMANETEVSYFTNHCYRKQNPKAPQLVLELSSSDQWVMRTAAYKLSVKASTWLFPHASHEAPSHPSP